MAFCQLAYVSDTDRAHAPDEVSDLIACARRNNLRDNITGTLLVGRAGFVQVVEGPREAVMSLLNRLENDHRHRNMVLLHKGDAHVRVFPDTPMRVRSADTHALKQLERAVPVLAAGLCSKFTAEAVGLV